MTDQYTNYKQTTKPCPDCNGDGRVPFTENYVTREMALDAGEPTMEGVSMGWVFVRCERCNGDGVVPIKEDKDAF